MEIIKQCAECGKEYKAGWHRSKYCGLRCKDKAEKRRRRQWLIDNPSYYAEYGRRARAKKMDDIAASGSGAGGNKETAAR